jgi:flavodoxin
MKTVLATSLLILISLITIKEAVYIALFQANQDYIGEHFCENKNILEDISERTCQGKCYVQKIIIESNTNDTNNHLVPTLDWEKTNYIVEYFTFEIPKITSFHQHPQGQLLNDNQGVERIFTSPPEVIA